MKNLVIAFLLAGGTCFLSQPRVFQPVAATPTYLCTAGAPTFTTGQEFIATDGNYELIMENCVTNAGASSFTFKVDSSAITSPANAPGPLLRITGSTIGNPPVPGTDGESYIYVRGYDSSVADKETALPIRVEIKNNVGDIAAETGGWQHNTQLIFKDYFPPSSSIEISGNTFHSDPVGIIMHSVIYFNRITLAESSLVTITENTMGQYESDSTIYVRGATLERGAEFKVTLNTVDVWLQSRYQIMQSLFYFESPYLTQAGITVKANTINVGVYANVAKVTLIAITDTPLIGSAQLGSYATCDDCVLTIADNTMLDGITLDSWGNTCAGTTDAVPIDVSLRGGASILGVTVYILENTVILTSSSVSLASIYVSMEGAQRQNVKIYDNTLTFENAADKDIDIGIKCSFSGSDLSYPRPSSLQVEIASNTITSTGGGLIHLEGTGPDGATGVWANIHHNTFKFTNVRGPPGDLVTAMIKFSNKMALNTVIVADNSFTLGSALDVTVTDGVFTAISVVELTPGELYICGNLFKGVEGGATAADDVDGKTESPVGAIAPVSSCAGAPALTFTDYAVWAPETTTTVVDDEETTTAVDEETTTTTTTDEETTTISTDEETTTTVDKETTAVDDETTTAVDDETTTTVHEETTTTAATTTTTDATTTTTDATTTTNNELTTTSGTEPTTTTDEATTADEPSEETHSTTPEADLVDNAAPSRSSPFLGVFLGAMMPALIVLLL